MPVSKPTPLGPFRAYQKHKLKMQAYTMKKFIFFPDSAAHPLRVIISFLERSFHIKILSYKLHESRLSSYKKFYDRMDIFLKQ
jgi:hypothetical protein